jgi:hypothetical protein
MHLPASKLRFARSNRAMQQQPHGTSRASLSALLDAGPSVHVRNHKFVLLLRQCESCNFFLVLTWMRGYF